MPARRELPRKQDGVSRSAGTIRRRTRREEGQVIVIMVLFLVVLCGFAGMTIDVGRIYVAQRQLQEAVDAAALAAAQDLPTTATANSDVTAYSAYAGQKNAHSASMVAATPVATYKCLSSTGLSCPSGSGQCSCNAIQVKESATVNTTFLRVLGLTSFTAVGATSTASMHGGSAHPLDVAVVLDTTGSMSSGCSNSVSGIPSGATKLDCAKEGVRALLTSLSPCNSTLANCGSVVSGNVPQPLDEVALFTFPGLTSPSAFTHDSTNALSNTNLELGCPGNLSATPTWYKPTTGSQNEIDQVTVNATSGSFFLQYPASTGTKTVNIAYNASAATILADLNAISGLNGNVTVAAVGSQPANTFAWSVTFTNTLGNQNLNNPLSGGLAASPNQLKLSTGTPSIAVTTTQNGSTVFPTWYLNSGDVGYPSGSANYASYQTVPLSSDYRTSDASSTLVSTSKLVEASSWSSCSGGNYPNNEYYGINAPGGAGTYIAYSITAAQAALAADSARQATPIMIVLSDGDASTQPTGSTDPCHEAVVAADAAAASGTEVYSIAYDADNTSSSCTQDSGAYASLTGFTTMQQIASDATKFYCLNPPTGQTCNNASASSLAQIFTAIGIDVTNARLVSDNAS
jgi:Flp pilus assembly protein TadG